MVLALFFSFALTTEAQSRTSATEAIIFEVAPDPRQQKLAEQWRRLSSEQRHQISSAIVDRIIPVLLQDQQATGVVSPQIGSYLDDTNPSFALHLEGGKVLNVAGQLACVLSQQSVLVMSSEGFNGSSLFEAVHIQLGENDVRQVDTVYQKVRQMDGLPRIDGQTTSQGRMTILLPVGAEADTVASAMRETLGGQFPTDASFVHGAWVGLSGHPGNEVVQQADEVADAGCERLRSKASGLLSQELGVAASHPVAAP